MNHDQCVEAAVDSALARANLVVSDEEHSRLISLYPLLRERVERLRHLDLGFTDLAVTYQVAPSDSGTASAPGHD